MDAFSAGCPIVTLPTDVMSGRCTQVLPSVHAALHSTYTEPEASWRRDFDPYTPLEFDLYHYLEQNGYF